MVIGNNFAWAHLPKTGGDATAKLFSIFSHAVTLADPIDSNDKHTTFAERRELTADRDLILNLRRLPSWILSFYQHANRQGLYPKYEPQPMPSPREMAESSEPDRVLSHFLEGGELEISRWLRMDYLVEDFLGCIARYTPVTDAHRARAYEIGHVNAQHYDHQVYDWFTPEQIALMYVTNSLWTSRELEVFGSIMSVFAVSSAEAQE